MIDAFIKIGISTRLPDVLIMKRRSITPNEVCFGLIAEYDLFLVMLCPMFVPLHEAETKFFGVWALI